MRLKLPRRNQVERIVEGLGPIEAIDALTESNRERRSSEIEHRLVATRHRAFDELQQAAQLEPPAASGQELPLDDGLPVLEPDQLNAATVRQGIEQGGSVLIRGLLAEPQVERVGAIIERAFKTRATPPKLRNEEDLAWFDPFSPDPPHDQKLGNDWNRLTKGGGTLWAADSPRGLFELLEVLGETGLGSLASDYLGARPALSMKKCNLRQTSPGVGSGADWHQDGSFLGGSLRALNVWAALTPCGVDAPGMDIVAKRLDEIVPTGTEGANFDWTVANQMAEQVAGEGGIVRPRFEAGDVLLFDELCLHRTAATEEMTKDRLAVEVWMFSGSSYPDGQVPLVF